jgi:hypothetical protein
MAVFGFTKEHLDYACTVAQGGVNVTKDDIPRKVQLNMIRNFTMPGYLSNPWRLFTTPADCTTHANLMKDILGVLGISASTQKIRMIRLCPVSWSHGIEHRCFATQPSGSDHTNFEEVCEVITTDAGAIYYDVALADKPYGTTSEMWSEGGKIIHHYIHWENH